MRYVTAFLLFIVLLAAGGCSRLDVQEARTHPLDALLPPGDPKIQRLIRSLIEPRGAAEYFTAFKSIVEAKEKHQLTDEVWLTQILVYLGRQSDDGGRVAGLAGDLMNFSRAHLGMDTTVLLKILAPYHERPIDDPVQIAGSWMLESSRLFEPRKREGENVVPYWDFDLLGRYLRSTGQTDWTWKVVAAMFDADPDAAIYTTTQVYLMGDEIPAVRRNCRELMILLLSLDTELDQQKPELNQKIRAKLDAMADDPQWPVRGYALSMIYRGFSFVNLRKDYGWAKRSPVPQRLANDPNPFVSTLAKEILERTNGT